MRQIKTFTLYLLMILAMDQAFSQSRGCKLTIDPGTSAINGHSNASSIRPGDTICLLPGQKSYLLISYIHGSRLAPVVIINRNGLVEITNSPNYGIKFDSCSFIKFSGKGTHGIQYGIKVNAVPGSGLSVDGLTTNIEIEGIEISNNGSDKSGIVAKTEPDCSFRSTRDKFILRDLLIHDNYIHHTGNEGMYIGSSKYGEGQRLNCNGRDTLVFPHLLRGVRVYNNRVEHTGWDAIQVSSADSGVFIHDNVVFYDSEAEIDAQMSGILVGGGTNALCYNNIIKEGKGDGIEVISLGLQLIFNNLVVNAGKTYKPGQNYSPFLKHGIFIGSAYQSPLNTYNIFYNTIVSPKSCGIRITDAYSTNNLVSNNIIINPGSLPSMGSQAYVNLTPSTIDVRIANNIFNPDLSTIEFSDPVAGNYDLKAISPAVNTGSDIDGFLLTFDLLNRVRPFAGIKDIGALECSDSSLLGIGSPADHDPYSLVVVPNPFGEYITLVFNLKERTEVEVAICDLEGEKVGIPVKTQYGPGNYTITINAKLYEPGFYILIFRTRDTVRSKKLIKLH